MINDVQTSAVLAAFCFGVLIGLVIGMYIVWHEMRKR